MANALKQFIVRKLKQNVPLAEIKQQLKEKGYAIEEINKAVREAIAGMDKRIPIHILIAVLFIGVVAIGAWTYLTAKQTNMCDNFGSERNSCQQAVKVALETYQGSLFNVEKKEVPLPPKTLESLSENRNVWVIKILQKNGELKEVGIDPETNELLWRGVG